MSLIQPVWSVFSSWVNLKAEIVFCISLSLALEDLCVAASPSISAVMKQCTLKWVHRWGKSRKQQHSMSKWHMDQHISHRGTICMFDVLGWIPNHWMCLYLIKGGEMCTHRRGGVWNWVQGTKDAKDENIKQVGHTLKACFPLEHILLQHFAKYPWLQLCTQVSGSLQYRVCINTAVTGNIHNFNSVESLHPWPFEWSLLCSSHKLTSHL